MINLVRFMLVVFLVVPNGLAFYMWKLADRENAKADLVRITPVEFLSERPFVAEGVLTSPSQQPITSLHFQEPCLAYYTKFDLVQTVTDSDGELEDRRTNIFKKRQQVPDLTVEFPSGKGLLDVEVLETFYLAKHDEIDELPDYVDKSTVPKTSGKPWYEIDENVFTEGQKVTVVGHLNQRGILEPHEGTRELIVFPGSPAECVAALQQSGGSYRWVAYGLIAMSVFASLLLLVVLKFVKQ